MVNKIRFDGQVAIVTGAGRGIGRAYALALAERGAMVLVNDIGGVANGEPWADIVAKEITGKGGKAVANYDSVATLEGGQAITEAALLAFGAVDILINNAGFVRRAMFADMTPGQIRDVVDVHLLGAFYATQPAWKIMQARNYGRILMTSSGATFGMQANCNYSAAKAGILGLMACLAQEGLAHNIRVNSILPYAATMITVDSPAIGPDSAANVALQKQLRPRMTGDSVTAAGLYLVSRECALTAEAISAVAGRYARVFTRITEGWLRENVDGVTPEAFAENLPEIMDTGNAFEPHSLGGELAPLIGRLKALGIY